MSGEMKSIGQIEKEFAAIKTKADKWDALEKKISAYYFDDKGNELTDDEGGNLLDIGEAAAMAFGFM